MSKGYSGKGLGRQYSLCIYRFCLKYFGYLSLLKYKTITISVIMNDYCLTNSVINISSLKMQYH